jgi:hypothetical protein
MWKKFHMSITTFDKLITDSIADKNLFPTFNHNFFDEGKAWQGNTGGEREKEGM